MNTTSAAAGDHRLHVALLPVPGRGHINPMLSLAQHLSDDNLLVSLIVTEEWAHLLSPSPLPLRTFPNVLPSEHVRGTEYASFVTAVLTKMAEPVERLISEMEPRVDLIVSDAFLPWAPAIGRRIGVPVAAFFPQSVTELFALFEFARIDNGREEAKDLPAGEIEKLLEYIAIPPPDPNPAVDSSSKSYILKQIRNLAQIISWSFKSHSLLLSSFYDLEKPAIDSLQSQIQSPVYPIGPLIHHSAQNETNNSIYTNWLDSKPINTVVYIALGSFLPVSKEQFNEIISGLNLSGSPYLLVLRENENNEEIKKIIGDKGFIVSWCDQIKVLSHPSIGGFMTHCGWNSILEGIFNNVPMITFPLKFDQIPNSNLITDDWRIGIKLRGDKEENIVTRDLIANVVRRMMNLEGEESKEIRNCLRGLNEKCCKALGNNGSSNVSLNDFVQRVIMDCNKRV